MGNKSRVGETCPHIKMLLDRFVLWTNAHSASLCHTLNELMDIKYLKVPNILL